MTLRHREMGPDYLTGTKIRNGSSSEDSQLVMHRDMYDRINEFDSVTGRLKDNNLSYVWKYCTAAFWNGSNQQTGEHLDAAVNLPIKLPYGGVGSWLDCPSVAASATDALAITNPGRSGMDYPVFVYELREAPELLRVAGTSLLRTVAGVNLAYQFAWKPLISDLGKLIDFTASIKKRKAELEKLESEDGLRRRVTVYERFYEEIDDSIALETQILFAHASRVIRYHRKRWVTVRWRPRNVGAPDVPDRLINLARDSLLGLRKGQITTNLWEAVPWSWLIDWFSNFGNFLKAGDQQFAYIQGNPNVMTETSTVADYTLKGDHPSWVQPSTTLLAAYRIQRDRDIIAQPGIDVTLPFLTGRQLSILGSLAILFKGR